MEKWKNTIVEGDCIELLSAAKKPFADLVFADPPFNIGFKYDKYKDRVKSKNYVAWTRDWMAACKSVLKPSGSFYIAIGDDYAANIKVIADEIGLTMRNWIIWHYTFGQQTKSKFARSHTHIFYFVNDKNKYTFNDYAVRVPSDRQLVYADRRANPSGKMPDDVWDEFSRVCGTFKEREGWHPCQMPEKLLARIITVSSNIGDCVLDPFMGSGTTAAVALRFGRSYAGIDISSNYVQNARKRLEKIQEQARSWNSSGLNWVEIHELQRLFSESPISPGEILESEKLIDLYTKQFSMRMNNGRKYGTETIVSGLRNLSI